MLYPKLIFQTILFWFSSTKAQSCYTSTQMPVTLFAHQVSYDAISNAVYVFGGHDAQSYSYTTNAIYKWNMNSDEWSTLSRTTPTQPFRSYANNAWIVNRKVYFIGIDDGAWTNGNIYIFDMETETWLYNGYISKMPTASIYGCLTGNTTDLFLIGGGIPTSLLDRLRIYNIADNSWTDNQINISPIQGNGWSEGYCNMVDHNVYIFGGYRDYNNNIKLNIMYKYDTISKIWSDIGNVPHYQANGFTARYNQYIYIIGGVTDSSTLNTIFEFDTESESITNTYYMSKSVKEAAVALINHKLYIFGGISGGSITKNVVICDILPNPTTSIPTTSIPTTSIPTISIPTTSIPTTSIPTTSTQSTSKPTTSNPAIDSTTIDETINSTSKPVKEATTRWKATEDNTPIPYSPVSTASPIETETDTPMDDDKVIIKEKTSNTILYIAVAIAAVVLVFCIGLLVFFIYIVIKKNGKPLNNDDNNNAQNEEQHNNEEKRLSTWCKDVLKLPQYVHIFKQYGYNMNKIQRIMDVSQLESMGIVEKPHQALILWQIKILRENDTTLHSKQIGEQMIVLETPNDDGDDEHGVEMEGVKVYGSGFDNMSQSSINDAQHVRSHSDSEDLYDVYTNVKDVTAGMQSISTCSAK